MVPRTEINIMYKSINIPGDIVKKKFTIMFILHLTFVQDIWKHRKLWWFPHVYLCSAKDSSIVDPEQKNFITYVSGYFLYKE